MPDWVGKGVVTPLPVVVVMVPVVVFVPVEATVVLVVPPMMPICGRLLI